MAKRGPIVTVVDKTAKIFAGLAVLGDTSVLVGIPRDEDQRDTKDSPIGNAALGYIHDTGEPAHNLPARPWLGAGIKTVQPELVSRFRALGASALDGKPREQLLRQYNAIGQLALNAVRRKLQQGPFTPLAQSTIAARKSRGRTGTRPLIDTGQLRNSTSYVVLTGNK